MTEKTRKIIIDSGAIGYSYDVALELVDDVDFTEMSKQAKNESSEFCKLYKKGKLKSRYLIDQKLLEMAQSGDIKAIDKLNAQRKRGI